MGGVGVRRASAVLLLVIALGLMALGALVNVQAAALAVFGTAVGAVVVTLDVDKLIGRG